MITGQGLPKSNQGKEDDISHQTPPSAPESAVFDRRAIPAAARESRWHSGDGHAIRRIDWDAAGDGEAKGSILFLPGRGDHYEKYLETLDEWARDGWRVTASDWRGQGDSGRLGADEITGHVDSFDIWLDDLTHLWREWVASTPGPHVLAGHSMGGHLVLRAVAEKDVAPSMLVLSAPMLGIAGPLPDPVGQAAAHLMAKLGDARRPAWKWSEKPGETPATRAALLTHDLERYGDEQYWRAERPEVRMGPGSWGWVAAAYDSVRALFRRGVLESVQVPVLIVATSHDKLVSWPAIRAAADRLPDCRLIEFGKEARHEILREGDAVRGRAMRAIADFLADHADAKSGDAAPA
jgi:lysophospholipase